MKLLAGIALAIVLSVPALAEEFVVPPLLKCEPVKLNKKDASTTCSYKTEKGNWKLKLTGEVNEYDLVELREVNIKHNGKFFQKLSLPEEQVGIITNDILDSATYMADLNFDGYDDLYIQTNSTAGVNIGLSFWLYNPDKKQFERADDLDDKLSGASLDIDPKSKELSSSGRSNCCSWGISKYGWIDKKLILNSYETFGSFELNKYNIPNLPVESLKNQFCGSLLKVYNKEEELTSITASYSGGDLCEDTAEQDYKKAITELKTSLAAKSKTYRVTSGKDNSVIINYTPPLKREQ